MQHQYSNFGNIGTFKGPRPNQSNYKQLDQNMFPERTARRPIERKQSKTQVEIEKTEKLDLRKTSLLTKKKVLPMPPKGLTASDKETLQYPDMSRIRRRNMRSQLESLSISDIDDDCSSISSFSSVDDNFEKESIESRFNSNSTNSYTNRDPELVFPSIRADGCSDSDSSDDDANDDDSRIKTNVTQVNKAIQQPLPPIPSISAPGYDDSEEEPMPPIPIINAPGFSDDEDTFQTPTINVPNDANEDDDLEMDSEKNEILDSLFGCVKCSGCKKRLSGQAFGTGNHHWHPKCFKCQECGLNLEHVLYHEYNGLPYCALDYHEKFSPRCAYCNTPIEEKVCYVFDKAYHPGHFFCRECSCPFYEDSIMIEKDGYGYCEKDYYKLFAPRCKGCGEHITGQFFKALGSEWHISCFTCAECGCPFSSSTFMERDNKPYCELHYQKKSTKKLPAKYTFTNLTHVKICHNCNEFIEGKCINAFGKDYHPEHFKCVKCNTLLNTRLTGHYQETDDDELICKPCSRKK